MPQLVAAFIIGAGLYAGLNWLSKTLGRDRREAEERLKRGGGKRRVAPKDLGTLEYDPETKTYRPQGRRGS